MFKINIKPKIKEQIKERSYNLSLLIICVVLIVIISITSLTMYLINLSLTNKIKKVEVQIESQQTENASLIELSKNVEKINKKLGEVKDLEQKRIIWSSILKEITNKVPQDLQINQFAYYTEKGKEKGEISGTSSSLSPIMQFRKDLEKINYFINVDFESASQKSDNSFEFKFTLTLKNKQ